MLCINLGWKIEVCFQPRFMESLVHRLTYSRKIEKLKIRPGGGGRSNMAIS